MGGLTVNLNGWRVTVLFCMLAAAPSALSKPLRQVVLVQNSGWMEPFYLDSSSPFKSFLSNFIIAAAGKGEVVMGGFNEADAVHPSPEWLYRGPGNHPKLATQIAGLELVRKKSGAYADTNFKQALLAAIQTGLETRQGIIWIVTNNKNSPGNSAETLAMNRDFYNLLHGQPVIARIAAFPVPMPVKGPNYRANGLMVYGIAYGAKAAAQLEKVIDAPALGAVMKGGPLRLKPLTMAAVSFIPTGVQDSPGIGAAMSANGKTLELDFDAGATATTATLNGRFENRFNPYQIADADVALRLSFPGEALRSSISADSIKGLNPGMRSEDLSIKLQLPALRSQWSADVIANSGYERAGAIDIVLSNQTLKISPQFFAQMEKLFPGDPLPAVFVPPAVASTSVTRIPVLLRVHYPAGPVAAVFAAGVLALLGLIALVLLLTGKRRFVAVVDGQSYPYLLKHGGQVDIADASGEKIATLKRHLFGVKVLWQRPDVPLRIK